MQSLHRLLPGRFLLVALCWTFVLVLTRPAFAQLEVETLEGANPGALEMLQYVPSHAKDRAPLVVVLHGCTQNAQAYASLAGWLQLADAHGFVVLAPQQTNANNLSACFNWFEPNDVARDKGELASIRNMISQIVEAERIASDRIFVTGVSAGGFMTTALMASYPELFRAGAVVAGGPFGCAGDLGAAFSCMQGNVSKGAEEWAALARAASSHQGNWPRLAIWHGDSDTTVAPNNADELLKQWSALTSTEKSSEDTIAGHARVRYGSAPVAIESVRVKGLGHAVAVKADECGSVGAFASEADVCSSLEIARFWGLVDGDEDGGDADGGGGDADGGDGDDGKTSSGGGCQSAGVQGSSAAGSSVGLLLLLLGLTRRRRLSPLR